MNAWIQLEATEESRTKILEDKGNYERHDFGHPKFWTDSYHTTFIGFSAPKPKLVRFFPESDFGCFCPNAMNYNE